MTSQKLAKLTIAIILGAIALLTIGWVGQLDHDEYIEVNSKPITRLP